MIDRSTFNATLGFMATMSIAGLQRQQLQSILIKAQTVTSSLWSHSTEYITGVTLERCSRGSLRLGEEHPPREHQKSSRGHRSRISRALLMWIGMSSSEAVPKTNIIAEFQLAARFLALNGSPLSKAKRNAS